MAIQNEMGLSFLLYIRYQVHNIFPISICFLIVVSFLWSVVGNLFIKGDKWTYQLFGVIFIWFTCLLLWTPRFDYKEWIKSRIDLQKVNNYDLLRKKFFRPSLRARFDEEPYMKIHLWRPNCLRGHTVFPPLVLQSLELQCI